MAIGGRDWKSFALGILEAGLAVTALFSVATAFDEWHRLLELFSHFRLQYLGVATLLTIAFLWLRWAGYVALGVATMALNAWYVVPWYLPVERPPAADTDLRVLHANVLVSNPDPARFLALVAEREPDVIVVQELSDEWAKTLRGLAADYPHQLVEPRTDPFGIALLSRYPMPASAVNAAAPRGFPEIVATIAAPGGEWHVIASHPMNPIGANGYGDRNLQLHALGELAARSPRPLIVIGDLNASMWGNHYRQFVDATNLRNAREGFGVRPTWPMFLPIAMIPIDHVLVSDDVAVTAFDTGPRIGSDHLPVFVTLQRRKP